MNRSIMTVALANVLLAMVALVRESRLAAFAGTTGTADAFMLALYFTDLAGNVVIATSISHAAVPVLSVYHVRRDLAGFRRTLQSTAGLVLMVSLGMLAVGWLAAPLLVSRIGMGLPDATRDLTALLFGYLLLSVPFFVLAALLGSALWVLERFAYPAFGPVALNLVLVLGLVFLAPSFGVVTLALSFVAGTVIMFLMQLIPLRRSGHLGPPALDMGDPGLGDLVRKSWPVMAGILLAQPGGAVEKLLASTLVEGSIAGQGYAFKLSQFPIWVFAAAVGTVVFPALAASAQEKDMERFKEVLGNGLVLTAVLSFPFTVGFVLLAKPIVSLLFQYGAFNLNSVEMTSKTLATYSLGLGAEGFVYLFVRASFSLGDMITPLKVAGVAAAFVVALDPLFVGAWGLPGLGLGMSAGALVQAVMLGFLLTKKIGSLGKAFAGATWRIGSACLCLAAAVYLMAGLLLERVEELPPVEKGWRVGLVVGVGAAVYLLALVVFRVREIEPLWVALRSKTRSAITAIRRA